MSESFLRPGGTPHKFRHLLTIPQTLLSITLYIPHLLTAVCLLGVPIPATVWNLFNNLRLSSKFTSSISTRMECLIFHMPGHYTALFVSFFGDCVIGMSVA